MTWLVLRYWYGYHRSKWQKWDYRKRRYEDKRGHKAFRVRYVRKLHAKHEHHRFWFGHYCELLEAYGHKIDCIHFGAGENTIQSGFCPYERRGAER
ncbi:hypothetical protein [Mycobacterium phage WXIN]|nr:hypothetical protein [Mycobacterium phage WXIN]